MTKRRRGDIEDVGNDIVLEKYITALLSARMLTDKEFKERLSLSGRANIFHSVIVMN